MSIDFNKYNPIKKPPLQAWTESTPVVLLSEYLKSKKEFGITLIQEEGVPVLHFNPGLTKNDIGSERWMIADNAHELFMSAVPDLTELIASGKLAVPEKEAGPSWHIESIRVAKPR